MSAKVKSLERSLSASVRDFEREKDSITQVGFTTARTHREGLSKCIARLKCIPIRIGR